MANPYQNPNVAVQTAAKGDNYAELSRLGKKGAQTKKTRKEKRMLRLLAQVRETLEQANEHICPID